MRLFFTVTSAPLPVARFHESGTPSAPHAASDVTAANDPRRIEPFDPIKYVLTASTTPSSTIAAAVLTSEPIAGPSASVMPSRIWRTLDILTGYRGTGPSRSKARRRQLVGRAAHSARPRHRP